MNTIGGVACLLIGFFGSDFVESALALNIICAILANLTMGFAVVMYSAYLPLLVDSHPDVLAAMEGEEEEKTKHLIESRLSSQGIRAGMTGQILYLIIAAVCILTGLLTMSHLVIVGGLWVLGFGTFAIYNLERRPGGPLPRGSNYCKESLDKLTMTCEKRSKLPTMFIFLFSYLIFSDGTATGPQQSYTRSIYSSALPKGHEAEFFGLYQITDKGTAWAGPLLVTLVTNFSSFRIGFFSLISFYIVGIPILFWFNHPQALVEKRDFETWEEEHKGSTAELASAS